MIKAIGIGLCAGASVPFWPNLIPDLPTPITANPGSIPHRILVLQELIEANMIEISQAKILLRMPSLQ